MPSKRVVLPEPVSPEIRNRPLRPRAAKSTVVISAKGPKALRVS